MEERAQVYAIAGNGESAVYGRITDDLQTSLAGVFQGYIREAQAMGQGPLGNSAFSRWTQDRVMATWLWLGLISLLVSTVGLASAGSNPDTEGSPEPDAPSTVMAAWAGSPNSV